MAGAAQQASYGMADNDRARAFVLANSREMIQQVAGGTLAGTLAAQVVTVQLRNVGLVKRLLLELYGTIAQASAEQLSLTRLGLANLCSNINVTDLSNYQRINTTGWHLTYLASLRRQGAYGASFLNDSPVQFGSNYLVQNCPAVVTAVKSWRFFYELPMAYSDTDLRGAIYSAVVNATWQLQFTIGTLVASSAAADVTLAVWQSSTTGVTATITMSYIVYQVYLDQLPFVGGNPVLPLFDLATGYLISNTNQTGLTAGQDFPIQYPNFRQILSTFFIYDQAGTLAAGTDINYIGIQAANLVFTYKTDPYALALRTRNTIGDDLPVGSYCIETRMQPINTTAYGNMQLVINPVTAAAGSNVLMGLEMLGIINQVANAGSLAGN